MGDSTESPDSRKQYSRRIRTPKKFFDCEASEVDHVNTSQDKNRKAKKDGKAEQNGEGKKKAKTEVRNFEESAKKSRKKATMTIKQDKRCGKNDKVGDDIVETLLEGTAQSETSADMTDECVETLKSSWVGKIVDPVANSKSAGQTKRDTDKLKETPAGSNMRKVKPRRSTDASGKGEKEVENDLERIVADANEVYKVKKMVDSLRNRPRNSRTSPILNCIDQSAGAFDEMKSKTHEDVGETLIKKNDLKLSESTVSKDQFEASSELPQNENQKSDSMNMKNTIQKNEVNDVTPSCAKKKVRKKKNDVLNNSVAIETSELNDPITPSRPARKKKDDVSIISVGMETPELDDSVSEFNAGREEKVDTVNNSVSLDVSVSVPKSGRKKKKNDDLNNSVAMETAKLDDSVTLSRSGRKRKVVNYSAITKENSDNEDEKAEREETPKRKRSRKSRGPDPDNDKDDLVESKSEKKQQKRRPPKSAQKTPDKETVGPSCPKCEFKSRGDKELREHMAVIHQLWWSTETPEGAGDPRSLRLVIKLRKFLNCLKCDKRLNTVQYYQHHIEWCGRENEVYACEACGNPNLKLMWKYVHQQQCTKLRDDLEQERLLAKKQWKAEQEKDDLGGKRHAAKKALTMLQDLSKEKVTDGHFSDDSVGDPDAEIDDKDAADDEEEEGEDEEIGDEEEEDNFDDSEDDRPAASTHRSKSRYMRKGNYYNYFITYNLMKKFMKENHSQELFCSWLPRKQNWCAVPDSECSQYVPKKSSSVQFTFGDVKNKQSLDLYQADTVSGSPIFYTGLNIWKLVWCPVPLSCSADQHLAIVGKTHSQDNFYIGQRSSGPGVIQIWNTTISSNDRQKKFAPRPCYSVAHDFGKVTEIKWCPSGCYQSGKHKKDSEVLYRLGVLAISCTDSTIRIFSLPQPFDLPVCEEPPVFKPAPVATLAPYNAWQKEPGPACTCFDWSMVRGHSKLVAGYSDGTVRLFCLSTNSPLLMLRSHPDLLLLPYHRFQPLGNLVRSVRFFAQTENRLALGSEDFETYFLNTDDGNCPLFVDQPTSMTVNMAASLWHPGIFQVNDDNYAVGFNRSRYLEMSSLFYYTMATEKGGERKDELPIFNLASQSACVWEVSVSNWINYAITADNRGTMCGMPLQDMTQHMADVKLYKLRQTLFTTAVVKNCEQTEGAESEKEVEDCENKTSDSSAKVYCKPSQGTSNSKPSQGASDVTSMPTILPESPKQTSKTETACKQHGDTKASETGSTVAMDTEETAGEKVNNDLDFDHLKNRVVLKYDEYLNSYNLGPVLDTVNDNYSRVPVGALMTVALNPNHRQCLWVAFGGQSGLVRIVSIYGILPVQMQNFMQTVDPSVCKKSGKTSPGSKVTGTTRQSKDVINHCSDETEDKCRQPDKEMDMCEQSEKMCEQSEEMCEQSKEMCGQSEEMCEQLEEMCGQSEEMKTAEKSTGSCQPSNENTDNTSKEECRATDDAIESGSEHIDRESDKPPDS